MFKSERFSPFILIYVISNSKYITCSSRVSNLFYGEFYESFREVYEDDLLSID